MTLLGDVQTAAPSIVRVSTAAADGVPRGISGQSQTVDVYSSSAITSGGFRLTYGGGSIISPCIAANHTELTAGSVSSAIVSANSFLNVTTVEGEPPFDGARRFTVSFHEPRIGVASLAVAGSDGECKWLGCSDGDDGECEEAGVMVDRDVSVVPQEGALEVRRIGIASRDTKKVDACSDDFTVNVSDLRPAYPATLEEGDPRQECHIRVFL